MNKSLQLRIQQELENADIEHAGRLLATYMKKYPYDYDNYSCKIAILMAVGKLEEANKVAWEAYHVNHYNVENLYNMAVIYMEMKEYLKAVEFLNRTLVVELIQKEYLIPRETLEQEINQMMEFVNKRLEELPEELKGAYLEQCSMLMRMVERKFDMHETEFHGMQKDTVGKFFLSPEQKMYFLGAYRNFSYSYFDLEKEADLHNSIGEFFPLEAVTDSYSWKADAPVFLPVVPVTKSKPGYSRISIHTPQKQLDNLLAVGYNSYTYYKCEKEGTISSNEQFYVGKPIPLKQDPKKKKLVMAIFVDSLTWKFLEDEHFQQFMPHTKKFFEKGLICTNAYSGSEYTYPSIATYATGLESQNHMMLNLAVKYPIPENQETLFETFKKAGYMTAKIGGNDGDTPNFGYLRGVDRCLYRFTSNNYGVVETVGDVIDQLEAFKDCNQFIWMEDCDLHDVAGGFQRTIDVEAKLEPEFHGVDNDLVSTVKQKYSENKCRIYEQEARHFDLHMSMLYQYLEDNYRDDEMVITFFADHGTAFMVQNERPFMSARRTNVPLMFRDGVKKDICNELIQSTDFAGILCKIANVPRTVSDDSNLPVYFGGEKQREYAMSQSIFPGDTYKIVFYDKDGTCNIESADLVQNDCRFSLEGCSIVLHDHDWNEYEDVKKKEMYLNIVRDKMKYLLLYNE